MSFSLDEWKKNLDENPNEACLQALTSALLKNVIQEYEEIYYTIFDYLNGIEEKNKHEDRLYTIFNLYKDAEKKLLDNLSLIERNIVSKLRKDRNLDGDDRNKKSCCDKNYQLKEEINIIKWWSLDDEK